MKYLALTALLIAGSFDIDRYLCNQAERLYWSEGQCYSLGEEELK